MFSRATVRRSLVFIITTICAASAALAWPLAPALAHAAYKSSIPAANSVVKTAPTQVSITFLEHLAPSPLNITVYDNKDQMVSSGSVQISSDLYTASIAMKGDGSDIYRVDWNNVSADDNDPTLGAFVFAVDPSGKSDKVTPTPVTVTPATSSGISPWVAVLTGIGGLALGAILTYLAQNRKQNAA